MKNLPDKIYLQVGEDINIDANTDFNSLTEVTWCKDKINDNDIVYIRVDQLQLNEETRKDSVKIKCDLRKRGKCTSPQECQYNYLGNCIM